MDREYLYDRAGVPGSAGSTWLADTRAKTYPQMRGVFGADVTVVGAGLTGVLTALRLAEAGARVVLIEGRRVASLVTGHTSAKATAQHGLTSKDIPADIRVPWLRANVAAVDRLESYAKWAESPFARIDSHVYVTSGRETRSLEHEAALYAEAGLPGGPVDEANLPPGMAGAVRLSSQGIFDPVALVDGLLAGAPENLLVFEDSLVREVSEEHGVAVVKSDFGEARSDLVVLASHVPFFDTLLYMTRLYQHVAYAFEADCAEPPANGMWYTDDESGMSWRPLDSENPTRMILSGGGHKSGQGGDERERYLTFERRCREQLGPISITRHWSTQDAYTPDNLPYIGKMHGRERCYLASGYGGWGMTTSVVAADILTALVGGTEHDLAQAVAPTRVGASGMVKLAIENADFVAQAFTEEIEGTGDPQDVATGEGRTMRTREGHLAVMRDSLGKLHVNRSHCAHMRCTVDFNEAEGTWDCPCHGSRYYGDGAWLQGPARRGLEPAGGDDA